MSQGISTKQPAADRREIRVFISSTFRDMQEEREELVKQIFPQLRRLCESRSVTWGEVDLRWGVPDEAKAEGKVLPLCLQEIEHCRPYFIGLLGERYGWVPEEIPPELLETQAWLALHRGKSVTALEILHGVLENPEMEKHAFFYFRGPAYAAAHPGFTEEDPGLREKLAKLKDDIRRSGFPVSEPFTTPKQLGEWVLRDLSAVIEELYPEKDVPNALDRAALDHEAYSASRRTVYIGRDEDMDRLNAHAAGDGPPLVIAGESGGGKSALLANWTHTWSQQHPETPVLVHFIGAAPDSANWMAMLRRLLGEFQRKFNIQIEIPDQPDALRMAFANALHMVAARGRLVLVLDALNQFEDRDGAPDLVWLPPVIPPNVRLVVSTLPGRPWEDLKKRGWPVMTVEPLTVPEREKLIASYLKRYSKALSPEPVHRIAAAPQTGNGLYLSTLLNELRQFGSYEKLNDRIDWYLKATNPVELYRKVIERWEQDYGQPGSADANTVTIGLTQRVWRVLRAKQKPPRKSVVEEGLSRLWVARRGLSEIELLESLGTAGFPLPHALWSPLFLAVGDALVNRGGLLTFAHDFLREAVRDAYLPDEAHVQTAHRTLAIYFEPQQHGPRQLDELPWQWQEAGEWQKLADMLAIPTIFAALWQKDQFEVKSYWTQIESHSPLRMEQVYAPVIQEPTLNSGHAFNIGVLLMENSKPNAARRVFSGLAEHFRELGNSNSLQVSLGGLAMAIYRCGDQHKAMALLEEQSMICLKLENEDDLLRAQNNMALILTNREDRESKDIALALHSQAERFWRKSGNKVGLAKTLSNELPILIAIGDLDRAMILSRECELLCRELGYENGLAVSLGVQAKLRYSRGDLDGSIALHKEEEAIFRKLGDKDGLLVSLDAQALILLGRKEIDGAMKLLKETDRLCCELGNKDKQVRTKAALAGILKSRGDMDGAMALYKETECMARELGLRDVQQYSVGGQAGIMYHRGDIDGAGSLYQESERLCRELGDRRDLAVALGGRALILFAREDLDGAMVLRKEEEAICRELESKDGLQNNLGEQGAILHARKDLDGAMALYREQESLCRELGDNDGLQRAIGNQAVILQDRGDMGGAMTMNKEQERICRALGKPEGLAQSLSKQAVLLILTGTGSAQESLELIDEALDLAHRHGYRQLENQFASLRDTITQAIRGSLQIEQNDQVAQREEWVRRRELNKPRQLAGSLANRAYALSCTPGHSEEALKLVDEALDIATRHGYQDVLVHIHRIRDQILSGNQD